MGSCILEKIATSSPRPAARHCPSAEFRRGTTGPSYDTECIVLSQSSDLTMREITTELIQPVLDRSVVREVAQLALDHALRSAENKLASG